VVEIMVLCFIPEELPCTSFIFQFFWLMEIQQNHTYKLTIPLEN